MSMPMLDPFSAASRPFISFDEFPKNPLGFAETLQPVDANIEHPYGSGKRVTRDDKSLPGASGAAGSSGNAWGGRENGCPSQVEGPDDANLKDRIAEEHDHAQHAHITRLPKGKAKPAREYAEPLPTDFPEPLYGHRRVSSVTSLRAGLAGVSLATGDVHAESGSKSAATELEVGSDEWMKVQVAKCMDAASRVLDFSRLRMKELSPRIADVQHLVTITNNRSPGPLRPSSPNPSPMPTASPRMPSSPIPGSLSPLVPPRQPHSPASNLLSADARTFSRTVSAPASSSYFSSLSASREMRYPSGLRNGGGLMDSPTITEASDEGRVEVNGLDDGHEEEQVVPRSDASPFQGALGVKRTLGRSKTGMGLQSPAGPGNGGKGVEIYLGHNNLTALPSALFEVTKLTVLILRNNQLSQLPAAVGSLPNLKELNISGNQIKSLPSAILDLRLEIFSAHPNPFLARPAQESSFDEDALCASKRLLSPLQSHTPDCIPTLASICQNMLISPRPPSNLPPLLEYHEFSPAPGQSHPLLDVGALHDAIPQVRQTDLERMLQAIKSASFAQSIVTQSRRMGSLTSSQASSFRNDLFPRSHKAPLSDDAATNPFFSPCPSPRHRESADEAVYGRASRMLFVHPAEERIEWREVFGIPDLPVRWVGCSPGCLDFLEREEEDGFELDSDWDGDESW